MNQNLRRRKAYGQIRVVFELVDVLYDGRTLSGWTGLDGWFQQSVEWYGAVVLGRWDG